MLQGSKFFTRIFLSKHFLDKTHTHTKKKTLVEGLKRILFWQLRPWTHALCRWASPTTVVDVSATATRKGHWFLSLGVQNKLKTGPQPTRSTRPRSTGLATGIYVVARSLVMTLFHISTIWITIYSAKVQPIWNVFTAGVLHSCQEQMCPLQTCDQCTHPSRCMCSYIHQKNTSKYNKILKISTNSQTLRNKFNEHQHHYINHVLFQMATPNSYITTAKPMVKHHWVVGTINVPKPSWIRKNAAIPQSLCLYSFVAFITLVLQSSSACPIGSISGIFTYIYSSWFLW